MLYEMIAEATYNVYEDRLTMALETGNQRKAGDVMFAAMGELSGADYQRLERYAYDNYGVTF